VYTFAVDAVVASREREDDVAARDDKRQIERPERAVRRRRRWGKGSRGCRTSVPVVI
jgi:hypothetical protein